MQIGRCWLSAQLASCSATKVALANDMMRWPRGPENNDDDDDDDDDDNGDDNGDNSWCLQMI